MMPKMTREPEKCKIRDNVLLGIVRLVVNWKKGRGCKDLFRCGGTKSTPKKKTQ